MDEDEINDFGDAFRDDTQTSSEDHILEHERFGY